MKARSAEALFVERAGKRLPSWEDAERQVQEWIEQLPYRALDVKLRTFP